MIYDSKREQRALPTFSQHGNPINIKIFVYIYGHNLKVLIERKIQLENNQNNLKIVQLVNLLNKVVIHIYI